ncbi:uncharacterized protein [Physcomitrium patens]|uniref:Uncharacterized protein n=2 Tax=Physcomitrium patens TaxID=3218 RepID=A9TQ73_PHYPA|nr:hypothetical protein PHYPA_025567 [Physcomitrium patens]
MAEGIALLSAYSDSDVDDDSPVQASSDARGSIVDYAQDEGHGDERDDELKGNEPLAESNLVEVSGSGVLQVEGIVPMDADTQEDMQTGDGDVQNLGENGNDEVPVPSAEEEIFSGFWPSPPSTPCPEELQAKFSKFLKLKEQGRNFNEDLRKSKGYRNPDFLQLAVLHQNINEIGSCFDPEIFDPHGYDKSDFADALAAEQRREADRREQERRQNQRTSVDFVRATQLLTSQKVSLAAAAAATNAQLVQGAHTIISTTSSTVHTTTTTSEVRSETRVNKKSKWDKAGHH